MLRVLKRRVVRIEARALRVDSTDLRGLAPNRPTPIRPMVKAVPYAKPVAEGDEVQWLQDLYDRHSDHVRNVILRHAGPQVDAEDLVQEVFLAAHRKRHELRAYAEPGGWLHLAALREVWKERRRSRTLRYLSLGMLTRTDESESADNAFQRRELADWAYAILDRLPERQRQAFLLSQVEGFTSAEIGRMLDCPEETVRSRVFHARRAFAKAVARRALADDARRRGSR
jgi:RNA polymerase sigma-70 factor (ECF subfamily)